MNIQKETIEVLQNRIKYLEAHLCLALQILSELEDDYKDVTQDLSHNLDIPYQNQGVEVCSSSTVELPKFLNSRTWKHQHSDMKNLNKPRDRLMINVS